MYVGAIRTKNVGIRIPGIGAHSEFIAMQILSESIILSELTLFRIGIRHAIAMHGGMHRINATMTSIELKNFKSLAEIRNANHSHIGYWLLQFPYQYVSNYRLFSAVFSRHSFHWVADRGGYSIYRGGSPRINLRTLIPVSGGADWLDFGSHNDARGYRAVMQPLSHLFIV